MATMLRPKFKDYRVVRFEMEARVQGSVASKLVGLECPGCTTAQGKPTSGKYRVLDTRTRKRTNEQRRTVMCLVCGGQQKVVERDGKFVAEHEGPPPPLPLPEVHSPVEEDAPPPPNLAKPSKPAKSRKPRKPKRPGKKKAG